MGRCPLRWNHPGHKGPTLVGGALTISRAITPGPPSGFTAAVSREDCCSKRGKITSKICETCPTLRKPLGMLRNSLIMGWRMGFEPTTTGITIRDSTVELPPPRTTPIRVGRACPTGIEPVTPSLEGWCSIRLSYGHEALHRLARLAEWVSDLVGVERFELPTSWSQTRSATRLRYTP